jgi:hypothetical protein
MPRYKEVDRGMKLLPIDLSDQLLVGTTPNRGSFQEEIVYAAQPALRDQACPTNGSDRGTLRSHDLTLFVRLQSALARAHKSPMGMSATHSSYCVR